MKFVKHILAIACAVFIASQATYATDRVVSLSGNDNNPGTLSSPLKTIAKAVSLCVPGVDTVTLRGGIYTESLTSSITSFPANVDSIDCEIRAYPGEQVVVPQTDGATFTGIGNKYVKFVNVFLQVSQGIKVSTSPLVVIIAPGMSVIPQNAQPGQTVTVNVSGAATTTDWVGMFTVGTNDFAHGANWKYMNNSQAVPTTIIPSASLTFTAPTTPGNYEMRMFASDGYTRLLTVAFTVTGVVIPPDPCVTSPARVTVRAWPSNAVGSRRLDYTTSGPAATVKAELSFTSSGTFLKITDTRGCTAEVKK